VIFLAVPFEIVACRRLAVIVIVGETPVRCLADTVNSQAPAADLSDEAVRWLGRETPPAPLAKPSILWPHIGRSLDTHRRKPMITLVVSPLSKAATSIEAIARTSTNRPTKRKYCRSSDAASSRV
jgi:hypothetical protein